MSTLIRHIDELGRIALPAKVKELGWTENTPLEITVLENGIVYIVENRAGSTLPQGVLWLR